MTGMILAAGLGTRLRPWTLHHPKALVPVDGVPMLERVIKLLKGQGCDKLIVNVHHFADQIIDFVNAREFGVEILISDESAELLDTGGGLLKASELAGGEPMLIHNVDILSTANLHDLYDEHINKENDITLLVSDRDSSRKLLFDSEGNLCGWHNLKTGEYKKVNGELPENYTELAFSGIYVVDKNVYSTLAEYSHSIGKKAFPIMDFLLSGIGNLKIRAKKVASLDILDIGKPDALEKASDFCAKHQLF